MERACLRGYSEFNCTPGETATVPFRDVHALSLLLPRRRSIENYLTFVLPATKVV